MGFEMFCHEPTDRTGADDENEPLVVTPPSQFGKRCPDKDVPSPKKDNGHQRENEQHQPRNVEQLERVAERRIHGH